MNNQCCPKMNILSCIFGRRAEHILTFGLLSLLSLGLGCIPPDIRGYQDTRESVGILQQTMGENVLVNKRPAKPGMRIYSGDNVSTGSNSKAIVRFDQGGFLELDEETDPDIFKTAYCLLIKILHGQVYVEGHDICIETPESDSFLNSAVNVEVFSDLTIITVFKGSLSITSPKKRVLTRGQRAIIRRDYIEDIQFLNQREMDKIIEWRDPKSAGNGSGTKTDMCRRYARTAVQQNKENIDRGCGFSGPRWGSDFNAHYKWCLKVPEKHSEAENRARSNALKNKCYIIK